jgi:hypothetical protein
MTELEPLFSLVLPLLLVGVLVLLLRWTWGRGRSLVPRAPRPGAPGEYGLLVGVAAPRDAAEAERLMLLLQQAGIRCTLAHTTHGQRLMVFRDDLPRARAALSER